MSWSWMEMHQWYNWMLPGVILVCHFVVGEILGLGGWVEIMVASKFMQQNLVCWKMEFTVWVCLSMFESKSHFGAIYNFWRRNANVDVIDYCELWPFLFHSSPWKCQGSTWDKMYSPILEWWSIGVHDVKHRMYGYKNKLWRRNLKNHWFDMTCFDEKTCVV